MMDIDFDRGKKAAKHLYRCFPTTGIFGNTEMPEDILPRGMKRGSLDHLIFFNRIFVFMHRGFNEDKAIFRRHCPGDLMGIFEHRKRKGIFGN